MPVYDGPLWAEALGGIAFLVLLVGPMYLLSREPRDRMPRWVRAWIVDEWLRTEDGQRAWYKAASRQAFHEAGRCNRDEWHRVGYIAQARVDAKLRQAPRIFDGGGN